VRRVACLRRAVVRDPSRRPGFDGDGRWNRHAGRRFDRRPLVAPEHRGRALATIFGGFTLAQVFGVPAGAWLGYAFGWRTAFWAVALLSAIAAAILFKLTPRKLKIPATSLGTLGEVLATPRLILAIAMTGLFFAALYAP